MGYEKRQFLYGMDFDTEERLVEPGFSRKNVNVRIGSSTDNGVYSAENVQGNTFIPNVELPTGENKVIGSYLYRKKNLAYIFIWNDGGNHGIYEYNHVSSKIVTVVQASVLNFKSDSLITGVNVVEFDENNDFLYWVDKSNPPRKININKAKSGDYQTPIKEEVIDAIKYPPLCPPSVDIRQDPDYKVNYINEKIFQFKAAYVYDDKEISAWSPISVQVLPKTICGGEDSQGNTIRIKVPKGGELVQRIKIAAREGNVNDFFQISDEDVEDYELDGDDIVYYFRNDKAPQAIELNQSNKLFDSLPQVAGAQEFIKNKITYADVTEGYDNVDVDFNLEVEYEQEEQEEEEKPLNTIKGVLRISQESYYDSFLIVENQFGQFQPIHDQGAGGIQYGGFSPRAEFEQNLRTDFKQSLPLGGFCLYLAGTDFYTISEQVLGNNSDLQTGLKNAYDSSSSSNRNRIRDEVTGSSSGSLNYANSRTWSSWQFNDVPDGTYILRVASNLTTSDDLLDPDRGYQKTSAFLNRIGFGLTSVPDQTASKELEVTVQNGQILDNIEVVIADLSAPYFEVSTKGLAGYLTDFESGFTPSSISEALGQKRIELAQAGLARASGIPVGSISVLTDHNGFFWQRVAGNADLSLVNTQSGSQSGNDQIGYDLFQTGSPSAVPIETTSNGEVNIFVIDNNESSVTNFSRTNVLITVLDSDGSPVSGVTVVSTNGDTQTTRSNGQAPFIVYVESGEDQRTVDFYPYLSGSCNGEFDISVSNFSGFIGQTTGYENNSTTTEIPNWILTLNISSSISKLKNGGTYTYGLVYYDRANRSGNTNLGDKSELVLPFYTEGSLDGSVSPIKSSPIVSWSIESAPPSWATHYQWVRTPNTALDRYLQWFTDDVSYSGGGTNFNDASILELNISNLTDGYKTANPDSVLVYDYTERDRIRLIKDNTGAYFNEYIDLKVLSFEAGVLKVENDAQINLSDGVFFEIYTPKLDVSEDIYYEIGECYEIGEVVDDNGDTLYFHKGSSTDQDPILQTPATGTFKSGDTYYRERNIIATGGNFRTDIDSQLFSDFWQSKVSDIGRPNKVDKEAKRVTRPTTIYYSNNFIPETNINGLNSFFDSSFETYDRNYGTIKKLFGINGRLDVYHELKVTKVLVQESIVYNQSDQGNIGISNSILSYPSIPYAGEYGTLNPESFTENEGRRYFFDVRNGKVLRLSGDGLTPISDNKMHSYFESKSNFYSVFNLIPEIWGTYDENHDEYIISFGSISREEGFTPDDLALVSSQAETVTETRDGLTYTFDIEYSENEQGVPTDFFITRDVENGVYLINSVAGDISLDRQKILSIPAETLAFSERTRFWTSFYTFTPECMVKVGLDYLSFRNGETFLHNTNGKRNSFYGGDSSSEVWAVFNQDPSKNKVFQALSQESDTVWEAREILTQNGQKSSLIKDDFKVSFGQGHTLYSKENIHYAALWKDENTPNVDIPLLEGDSMRDASVLVKLINGSTEEERLFAVSMNYSNSERSNR